MSKIVVFTLIYLCISAACQQSQQQPAPQMDEQSRIRQQLEMKRTACLVLSRYHSSSHKQHIESLMESLAPDDRSLYVNKMYAVAVQTCMPIITMQQAAQFFTQAQEFDPVSMFPILDGFDYVAVADDLELTPNQKNIVKFIKKFDEEMQVRKEEKEAEDEDVLESENEIGLFGISVRNFNNVGGYFYIAVLSVAVIAALVWGFGQLNNSSLPKPNKKKDKASKKRV